MGLISNDNDVLALRQNGVSGFVRLEAKLFDGCEYDFSALRTEKVPEVFNRVRVLDFTYQAPSSNKLIVQLIIEISSINLDNERGVPKRTQSSKHPDQKDH